MQHFYLAMFCINEQLHNMFYSHFRVKYFLSNYILNGRATQTDERTDGRGNTTLFIQYVADAEQSANSKSVASGLIMIAFNNDHNTVCYVSKH